MAFFESHSRTFTKTLIYRVILIVADGIIVYGFTRRLDLTLGSIGVISVANTLLYYFYERVWNNVHWGKKKINHKKRKKS